MLLLAAKAHETEAENGVTDDIFRKNAQNDIRNR